MLFGVRCTVLFSLNFFDSLLRFHRQSRLGVIWCPVFMYSDETFFFKSNHFTSLEQQGYFHFQAKEAGGSQVSLMGPILFLSHQTFCHASPTGAWQVCMDNFQQFHLPSSDMTDQHQSYQDTDTAFLRVHVVAFPNKILIFIQALLRQPWRSRANERTV